MSASSSSETVEWRERVVALLMVAARRFPRECPSPVARLILSFDEDPIASLVQVQRGGRLFERMSPLFSVAREMSAPRAATVASVAVDPIAGAWIAVGDRDGHLLCAAAPFVETKTRRVGHSHVLCAASPDGRLVSASLPDGLAAFRVEPDGAPTPVWEEQHQSTLTASRRRRRSAPSNDDDDDDKEEEDNKAAPETHSVPFDAVCVTRSRRVVASTIDGGVVTRSLDSSLDTSVRALVAPREENSGSFKDDTLFDEDVSRRRYPLAVTSTRLVVGDDVYKVDGKLRSATDRVAMGLRVEAVALVDDHYVAVAARREGVLVLRVLGGAGVRFYARLLSNDVPTHSVVFHGDWLAVSRGGKAPNTRELTVWSLARADKGPPALSSSSSSSSKALKSKPQTTRDDALLPGGGGGGGTQTKPLCFFLRHRATLDKHALALAFRERRRSLCSGSGSSSGGGEDEADSSSTSSHPPTKKKDDAKDDDDDAADKGDRD